MGTERRSAISREGLVRLAQASDHDDTWAMGEIVRRFRPLARRLAGEAGAKRGIADDLESAAYLGLVQAVRRHDGRAGFPTFVERYMRGEIWRERDRLLRHADRVEPAPERVVESAERTALERLEPWGDGKLAAAVARLSEEQQRLVDRLYVEDSTLGTIAAEVGVTVPAISQRLEVVRRACARRLAASPS